MKGKYKRIQIDLTPIEYDYLLNYYKDRTDQVKVIRWKNNLNRYIENHLLNIVKQLQNKDRDNYKNINAYGIDWLQEQNKKNGID